MNQLQQNPFAAAVLAIAVLGSGTIGFFVFKARSTYLESDTAYQEQVVEAQRLQEISPFPEKKNADAMEALLAEYQVKIGELRAQVSAKQIPLEKITPTEFQDRLLAALERVRKDAAAANVTLPDKFQLGFPEYESQLPPEPAVPALALNLKQIEEIVGFMIKSQVRSIDDIIRVPVPGEAKAPEPRASGNSAPSGKNNGKDKDTSPVLDRYTFIVKFTASPLRLRQVVARQVDTTQLTTIQLLRLENEQTVGPKRAKTTDAPSEPSPTPAPAPPMDAQSSKPILGEEQIKAEIRFQLVRLSDAPKKEKETPKEEQN